MSRRFCWLWLAILFASGRAMGQQGRPRLEAFFGVGASRVGEDERSLGSGPSVLGGFGVRLIRGAALEAELIHNRHDRKVALTQIQGTTTGAFVNVVYHVGQGRTRFFALGSIGGLNYRTNIADRTVVTRRRESTDFAWGGGLGVKVFLTPRLSLRPQFRYVFSETSGILGHITVSVAVGYHWGRR